MPSDNTPGRQPQLSVVIPAYNETAHLGNLIESIRQNLYDLDLEIVVVDNGSTDDTAELARQAGVNLVTIPKDSISKARNLGVASAAAEVIAFIDADVRLTREWAVAMKQRYTEIRDQYLITGSRYMIPEEPSDLDKYWFEPLSEKEVTYINGGNLILSKSSFDKIGGFDESLTTGEDFEFCVRARHRGAQIVIDRELQAIHDGFPKTLLQFCKREIWHGIGDFQGLHRFLESKVAIAAVVFVLIHLLLIGALLNKAYLTALFFALLLVLISFAVSKKIFRNSSIGIILHNTPYCYFYLISRFLSLPKLLLNKIS
ncbi:MAG: glycosyltransferase [Candidatus Thiodiazotropha endolucinida]|nr:glycosyltransferase [Candidatus Thiodiazotropha taylori]MCW4311627.1 glycosyltransferase [Candidatus Thiodiazotropha taylori]